MIRRWMVRLRRHRVWRRGRPVSRGWGQGRPVLLTAVLGVGMAAAIILSLEARLQPIVATAAQAQAVNTLTAVVDGAIAAGLGEQGLDYADFVAVHRDETGGITSLVTDMAAMNHLRAQLVARVLSALEEVEISQLAIPLGSLWDSDFLWARGPKLRVHAMRVGTVSAEFSSQFSEAGINQTLHRIYLDVRVPLTLILPGGQTKAEVAAQLCVAETVIVGQVPGTYLTVGQ